MKLSIVALGLLSMAGVLICTYLMREGEKYLGGGARKIEI